MSSKCEDMSTKTVAKLTLPQEEIGGLLNFSSISNCSARPQEQFLQALRFPLVSQSGPVTACNWL